MEVEESLTAHELAKILLAMPNDRVFIDGIGRDVNLVRVDSGSLCTKGTGDGPFEHVVVLEIHAG